MSQEQASRLAKKGIIVSKGAVDSLTKKRADRILSMKHKPMYVNEQFLDWMKGKNVSPGISTIEATQNIPSFTGVDGKVYYLTWSEERRIPQANADILVNRGLAERAT